MPTFAEIANMKVGIWNYSSGTSGSVDFDAIADPADPIRVISITAIAGASDATIEVDNRGTVTIPANQALTLTPNGTIRNPGVTFTNTANYVIEYVTNNF